MSINLNKGQSINLSKNTPSLSKIMMGLGWDMAQTKSKGFLGMFSGGSTAEIDLDASAVLLDATGNVQDTVWFRQLNSKDGSVRHGGDNLTGAGDGDDERIFLDLSTINANVKHVVFTVSSFRGQSFSQVANAFCRIVNSTNNQELARFNLSAQGQHTSILIGKLSRSGSDWEFTAVGELLQGSTVQQLLPAISRIL